jgi:hypothetical protein
MKTLSCFILLIGLNGHNLLAQQLEYILKQELIHKQLEKVYSIQDSVFDFKKEIINGKLYYSGGNEFSHPYFIDNLWKHATVFLNSSKCELEMTKYDLSLDYLVYLNKMGSFTYPIYLNKESVKAFMINGHKFKYIDDFIKSSDSEPLPGYYEVIYDGLVKFYIRRVKVRKLNGAVADEGFSERIYFFLKKDGKYFRILSQKSLINALSDHKEEIKTFLNKNKLRFSRNNYGFLGAVLIYYDNL